MMTTFILSLIHIYLISNSRYKVYALSDDDSLVVNSITDDVIQHYDLLVKENNDPVHDPKPLRDYMDKWDGQVFIDKMKLDKDKSDLEIGVGTGRLAVRVCLLYTSITPFCCKISAYSSFSAGRTAFKK